MKYSYPEHYITCISLRGILDEIEQLHRDLEERAVPGNHCFPLPTYLVIPLYCILKTLI